jgi:hypothetical protein
MGRVKIASPNKEPTQSSFNPSHMRMDVEHALITFVEKGEGRGEAKKLIMPCEKLMLLLMWCLIREYHAMLGLL